MWWIVSRIVSHYLEHRELVEPASRIGLYEKGSVLAESVICKVSQRLPEQHAQLFQPGTVAVLKCLSPCKKSTGREPFGNIKCKEICFVERSVCIKK